MEIPRAVGARFRAEITRRDPSAAEWLERLPGVWTELSAEWHLEAVGTARAGATSLVVPVVTPSGVRAALKLVSPVMSMDAEAAALSAFGGRGAVTLLEADSARRAVLLEWIDGPSLAETADRGAAMSIAGRLTTELAAATPPSGAPRLAGQTSGWIRQLRAQHEDARRAGTALPEQHLKLATEIIRQLAADGTTTLTHGDLSLSNILQAAPDRWVAVDPALLVGTAANEAHTVVRGLLPTAIEAEDPLRLLGDWARRFTEAAGVDHSLAQALSFARFVSSYYWESQHRGAPADVAALRRAALLLARSL
ncbi:aminoglycoside phosphotransferase family protein [Rathayibacter oskolensis]|nr:aminoglycoside phosphotransferase family protein [Rathayibacter oskolensis]